MDSTLAVLLTSGYIATYIHHCIENERIRNHAVCCCLPQAIDFFATYEAMLRC